MVLTVDLYLYSFLSTANLYYDYLSSAEVLFRSKIKVPLILLALNEVKVM
jgi:hypothetical protein